MSRVTQKAICWVNFVLDFFIDRHGRMLSQMASIWWQFTFVQDYYSHPVYGQLDAPVQLLKSLYLSSFLIFWPHITKDQI